MSDQSIGGGAARMRPWLGWTTITDSELKSAQRLADQGDRGVRDELGLSAVHFLYSERFFPGTSTQMFRLRYVMFVAAAYEKLRHSCRTSDLDRRLATCEQIIGQQLVAGVTASGESPERKGIIGWTLVERQAPVLLPSMSYWTALMNWGLLAGDLPAARSTVHGNWDRYARRRGKVGEVDTHLPLFEPELEEAWRDGIPGTLGRAGSAKEPLDFHLSRWERDLLQRKLRQLCRDDQGPTLLARLARSDRAIRALAACDHPWDRPIADLIERTDPDRRALENASRAAHVVQIARAIYDVLVAGRCVALDKAKGAADREEEVRGHLAKLVASSAEARHLGLALSIDSLSADAEGTSVVVNESLLSFLNHVQNWLRADATNPDKLLRDFLIREKSQKQATRARLVPEVKALRQDWLERNFRPSDPLDYRWSIVGSGLLTDLATPTA